MDEAKNRLRDLLDRMALPGPIGTWGPVNVETSLEVASFPVNYQPTTNSLNKIRQSIAGVAFNHAAALNALENDVLLTAVIGQDPIGKHVMSQIATKPRVTCLPTYVQRTSQTIVLHDRLGQRDIFFDKADTDTRTLPHDAIQRVSQCVITMFSNHAMCAKPILRARELHVPIVVDVHTMHVLEDDRNIDFCKNADVLFMSDDLVYSNKEAWLQSVTNRFDITIAVLGMGAGGSLITCDGGKTVTLVPAYDMRPVQSTVGAGDALAAAFIDGLHRGIEPVAALHRASIFAGHKVGAVGGAEGFFTLTELENAKSRIDGHADGWLNQ